jgi:hypothetical protein
MYQHHLDISSEPVKNFLDAVDSVLNSNTFLVEFEVVENQVATDLLSFLKSAFFISQLTQQDLEREWFNLHDFDGQTGNFQIRKGSLLSETLNLETEQIADEKLEYLTAMLTTNSENWGFCSYHSQGLDYTTSKSLVSNLISFLCNCDEWHLYVIQPNFLKFVDDTYSNGEDIRYFERKNSNNTATVIQCNNKGFLLLTNGIP